MIYNSKWWEQNETELLKHTTLYICEYGLQRNQYLRTSAGSRSVRHHPSEFKHDNGISRIYQTSYNDSGRICSNLGKYGVPSTYHITTFKPSTALVQGKGRRNNVQLFALFPFGIHTLATKDERGTDIIRPTDLLKGSDTQMVRPYSNSDI
jgi:hypothetical protein